MKTFLKWWYMACTVAIAMSVLAMVACVTQHLDTHDDQLLVIADYARHTIFGALAAAILPLPIIWLVSKRR